MLGLGDLRDLLFRMLPHRCPTGLFRIGNPDRNAPVLATGNFALTVRRLRRVLAGRDVWLLVANSRGINVWCAAGGGHLTHHDFIAALRASGADDEIDRHRLIIPQLAATGVERRAIHEATGWDVRWGPADMADLPAYLDRGGKLHKGDRTVEFPLSRRIEMAAVWALWMAGLVGVIGGLVHGWRFGAATAIGLSSATVGLYALMPWLHLAGPGRFPTVLGAAALGGAISAGLLAASGDHATGSLVAAAAIPAAMVFLVSLDFAGTTPLYPSDINTRGGAPSIEVVEARCTGAADCVQVCPRDVLEMTGKRRKVAIVHPDQCLVCGACIMQCPEDALQFRYDDGRVVGPDVIRTTHLNLLGKRASQRPV